MQCVSPFRKPIPTMVDLDADVLAWLKNQGCDYHTFINTILRTGDAGGNRQNDGLCEI